MPMLPNVGYYAIYSCPLFPYYALKKSNRLLTLYNIAIIFCCTEARVMLQYSLQKHVAVSLKTWKQSQLEQWRTIRTMIGIWNEVLLKIVHLCDCVTCIMDLVLLRSTYCNVVMLNYRLWIIWHKASTSGNCLSSITFFLWCSAVGSLSLSVDASC